MLPESMPTDSANNTTRFDQLIPDEDDNDNEGKSEELKKIYEAISKVNKVLNRVSFDQLDLVMDTTDLREAKELLDDINIKELDDINIHELFDLPSIVRLWETQEESDDDSKDEPYDVEKEIDDETGEPIITCTCPDYRFNREKGEHCKHIKRVLNRGFTEQGIPRGVQVTETTTIE